MVAAARAALAAAAKEFHAVTLDLEFRSPGEGPRQPPQLAIRELHDEPAAVAHQMVAMALCGPSVVAVPVFHVDMLDQVKPFQEVHGAVHARQADPWLYPPGAPVHLGHFQVFRAGGQDLQHRPAGPGEPQSLVVENVRRFVSGHRGPI
jgi:hypothetical protein